MKGPRVIARRAIGTVILLVAWLAAGTARAEAPSGPASDDSLIQLDFDDVELSVVIDAIAQLTGKNFIYDDRVRGRVTIVSPRAVSIDQAYAIFESVLQMKGFATVATPGGAIKVIPSREAKGSAVDVVRGSDSPPSRDGPDQ